jgi:hypothetical protein
MEILSSQLLLNKLKSNFEWHYLYVCMYVCCLFNNIEYRANPLLYTIVQYIKTSVDSTMLKLGMRKKSIYKMYDSKKNKKKLFQIVGIFRVLPLDHIEIRPCQFYRFIDLVTLGEVNHHLPHIY